jgi:hypothetical protein
MAGLKHQEARVYSRTGSRFVDLPHCPYRPEAPPTYKVGLSTSQLPFNSGSTDSQYQKWIVTGLFLYRLSLVSQLMDLIEHWNPDDSAIPPRHYNTMCRFNYQTEYSKALAYRDAEVRETVRITSMNS